MAWDDSMPVLSTSERSNQEWAPKRNCTCQVYQLIWKQIGWSMEGFANKALWAGAIQRGIDWPAHLSFMNNNNNNNNNNDKW